MARRPNNGLLQHNRLMMSSFKTATTNSTWKFKVSLLECHPTLSTTEAEFCNLTPAGQALLFVRRFLWEMGLKVPKPLVLFTDSMNAKANVLEEPEALREQVILLLHKHSCRGQV